MYQDFYSYHSGVYTHTSGKAVGGHAIKMLGFVSVSELLLFCFFFPVFNAILFKIL